MHSLSVSPSTYSKHDVGVAVVLAEVDDRHHVRVRELRHRARLAPEALELVLVLGELGVHDLDGHPALERLVERAVDGGHAAGADPLLQAEAPAEQGADHAFSILRHPWL